MDQFNDHELRLSKLIADLNLDELSWNNEPWPDEIELGLLQLESRAIRLQGTVLQVFLTAWVDEFLIANDPALKDELEEYFELIFDEKGASLTRFVLRNHLKGGAALSLNELSAHVHDSTKESFRTASNRLIKRFHDAMSFTEVWNIETVTREIRGTTQIGGYLISAGRALIDWEERIWRTLRREQLRQFHQAYGDQL